MAKTLITSSTVEADVSFGKDGENYGLAVDMKVNIPSIDQTQAEELVAKAY
jgi:osmotically inducible protein OsmC